MSILPTAIYNFSAFAIKMTPVFFKEMKQIILKFVWHQKGPQIAKKFFKNKNEARDITLLDFKIYYKALITRIAWYWQKRNKKKKQPHRPVKQSREPRY